MKSGYTKINAQKYQLCSIEGCEKPQDCRGWCRMHYHRYQRHGDPLIVLKTIHRHGLRHTPEYKVWDSMLQRCHGPNADKFVGHKHYFDKGITVCERWRSGFEAFYSDMGPRPSPLHSIDRIDGSLGYSLSNCRWATWDEQNRNRSFANTRGLPTGVGVWPKTGKFRAVLGNKYLGTFTELQDAIHARVEAEREYGYTG